MQYSTNVFARREMSQNSMTEDPVIRERAISRARKNNRKDDATENHLGSA